MDRTSDNTLVVRGSQTAKDDILFVDKTGITLLRAQANGQLDLANPAGTYFKDLSKPYDDDFALADVNGDGRTDFIHDSQESVVVFTAMPTGLFRGGVVTTFGAPLPSTEGVLLRDVNRDTRADLIWIDRQEGVSDGRRAHVRLASKEKAGTFEAARVFPLELGDPWTGAEDSEGVSQIGGYDVGDLDGDGNPDLATTGTFGQLVNGVVQRTTAIFVKAGSRRRKLRGDARLAAPHRTAGSKDGPTKHVFRGPSNRPDPR